MAASESHFWSKLPVGNCALSAMKILYAEDDESARYLLEILLRSDGHDVVTVSNGEAALQTLHNQDFDLIISDILMPKMDGFMLCHLVKSDPTLSRIPFILYSATYTQPDDIAFARNIGADEFFIKPLPPEDFLQELACFIARHPQGIEPPQPLDELAFLSSYAHRVGSKLETTHSRLDLARQQLDLAREELQQTRRMFGVMADHSSDAILVIDVNGYLLFANSNLKKQLDISDGQTAFSLYDLLPKERCAALLTMLLAPPVSQQSHDFKETLRNGNSVLITSSMVQYARSPALLLVMRNLDNYIHQHAPADFHTHVLENLTEGVMITDVNNKIVSVNPAFVLITGYQASEVLGKNPRQLKSGKQDLTFYKRMWSTLLSEGKWQGEIWNSRKNGEIYPEWLHISTIQDESGRIAFHVGIFSDFSEHEQARRHIEHLAHHDALTDLPNRALLNFRLSDAIHHAARGKRKAALLFMDLDRFKIINDTLGHQAGDELLKIVADRLSACVRQVDTVGRQGGDEFLIVLTDIANASDAYAVAEKILSSIRNPCQIGGKELNITPSIGIAIYPDHGNDEATLIQHADDALYFAKDEGRNNAQFYNKAMHRETEERLTLDNALAQALERGEMRLVYQPQVRMNDNALVGCEVLLRWHHPELGNVPPSSFIPVAEETGRINAIGEWVLRTACQQAALWQQSGLEMPVMAVNLSAIQFRQPNLLATIQNILNKTGLAPEMLELELTEGILMREVDATLEMLQKLKAMRLKLSIDDFGTGYSNLSYLNRFSVNKLKIDQSFVFGLPGSSNDAAIVHAIIQMANSLELEVIAEGVETPVQRDFLIAHGCLLAQGYLYAKPLEKEDFEKLLRHELKRMDKT